MWSPSQEIRDVILQTIGSAWLAFAGNRTVLDGAENRVKLSTSSDVTVKPTEAARTGWSLSKGATCERPPRVRGLRLPSATFSLPRSHPSSSRRGIKSYAAGGTRQ